ncbi:hypothetical protein LCGC14_0994760 [marine sediment metagenome]|uniref:Uncharacterized protein n=1 Tax=marine sediment metagenome TaxID=412755 RepID=A0A0F9N4R4_9ZZZZ
MACYLFDQDTALNQMIAGYSNAFGFAQLASTATDNAYDKLLLADYFWVNIYEIQALEHLVNAVWALSYRHYDCDPLYAVPYYILKHTVTYRTIAEAWAKNSFEGRMVTIAFIDRMRQLLWDEEYFVKWAAAPETSEGP